MRRLRAIWLVLAMVGCGEGEEPDGGEPPTYWRDVFPVLASRCHQCHLDGPSSYQPWFDSYENVAQVAGGIASAVRTRDMPPWAVTADGSCGDWDRSHWLADGEIAALEAWASSDLLEGEPEDAATPGLIPSPRTLRAVDAVVDPGVEYQPLLGDRLHRCFRAELSLESTAYLTAFEVVPGNPRAVQHVSLYAIDTDEAAAAAAALDEEDGEPGYHCFGGTRVRGSRLLGTWTWGEAAFRFPDGTGVRIDAGRDVVMQIHYNTNGGGATPDPDRTRALLELTGRAREGRFLPLELVDLDLPPGRQFAQASALLTIPESIDVHGVFPFMHSLGHSMLLLRASGDCLVQVRDWHLYGHMRYYGYGAPARLEAGDRVWLECNYDTGSRGELVEAGESFEAEACRLNLYATAAPGTPAAPE